MLHMRPAEGRMASVRYSPGRDVAYLFPNMIENAERFVYNGPYAPLKEWCEQQGITDDHHADAVQKLCQVVISAHDNPDESLYQVLERTGFTEIAPPVRVALMYYIGVLTVGTFFGGIRDLVILDADTTPEVKRLLNTADRLEYYIRQPRWYRRWLRFKNWFRRRAPAMLNGVKE